MRPAALLAAFALTACAADPPIPSDTGTVDLGADLAFDAPTPTDRGPDVADVAVDTGPDVSAPVDVACPAGQTRCSGSCVDTRTSADHCGACDARCTPPHGAGVCINGGCEVGACASPYRDCDSSGANGCETDTSTNVSHCGGCGTTCPARPRATASCVYACAAGFAHCSSVPTDGCETGILSDARNCGACGRACTATAPNTVGSCAAGECRVGCAFGYVDCDGASPNGCEANIVTDARNCGACAHTCASASHATPTCTTGACGLVCEAGWGDCDGNPANGCETNTSTNISSCGRCGAFCAPPHAMGACVASRCTVASCAAGFGDCDSNATNGCETDLGQTAANCGTCRHVCPAAANALPSCFASTCRTFCLSGFLDCDGATSNGCEVDARTSVANCGMCGNRCAVGQTCRSGLCVDGG